MSLLVISKKLRDYEIPDYLEKFSHDLLDFAEEVEMLCHKYDMEISGRSPKDLAYNISKNVLEFGKNVLEQKPDEKQVFVKRKSNKKRKDAEFKFKYKQLCKYELIPKIRDLRKSLPYKLNIKVFEPLLKINIKNFGVVKSSKENDMLSQLMKIAKKLENTELFDYLEEFKKDLLQYTKEVEILCKKYNFKIEGKTPSQMVEKIYNNLLNQGKLMESPQGIIYIRPVKTGLAMRYDKLDPEFKTKFRRLIHNEFVPKLKKLKKSVPFKFNPKMFAPLLKLKIKGFGEIYAKKSTDSQSCKYCKNPAIKSLGWAEGRAYIPVCEKHYNTAKDQIEKINKDSISFEKNIKANIAPINLDKAPNCKFCNQKECICDEKTQLQMSGSNIKKYKNELQHCEQKLRSVQNGANIHKINNLINIIWLFYNRIEDKQNIDKNRVLKVINDSNKLYKRYSNNQNTRKQPLEHLEGDYFEEIKKLDDISERIKQVRDVAPNQIQEKMTPVKEANNVGISGIDNVFDKISFIINAMANPAKNYPPSNIATWIKQCETKGRKDLAQKIMNAWNNVVDKYPNTRINWGAAIKIGSASVKKNVFGKKEFIDWFEAETKIEFTKQEEKVLKKVKEPKVKVPSIAIPKDNETPEQWSKEANKTKLTLVKTENTFNETEELIKQYQLDIVDFERKIVEYDVGGSKHLKKDGTPHKFVERIPKWKQQIETYKIEIAKLQQAVEQNKENFKGSKEAYSHAPVTTVEYEKTAQSSVISIQDYLTKLVKDKNWDLLEEVAKSLKSEEKKVASINKEALFEGITKAFGKVINWIKSIGKWITGFNKTTQEFHKIAYYVGR